MKNSNWNKNEIFSLFFKLLKLTIIFFIVEQKHVDDIFKFLIYYKLKKYVKKVQNHKNKKLIII